MFENILHQPVTEQLRSDAAADSLAPAMLFSGPEYSGKGTAALELARVLCCEKGTGAWNCGCSSCAKHRSLVSPDILLLGRRRFFEENAAASAAFLRDKGKGVRMLFIRSVRKLLGRFAPALWEDDPKIGKVRSQISALEEDLDEFEALSGENGKTASPGQLEKVCDSLLKKGARLESEGLGEFIPISQIRRASWWSRLAPLGKRKCIIIENAEQMKDEAKNALLKILEEPPPRITILLTSSRPMSLLPTMLSRLRDYRFAKRSLEAEAEVITRIFREPETSREAKSSGGIETYLGSFLPVGGETLYSLGAYFTASAAACAVRELRLWRREIPPVLADLGKFAAPIAEQGGMGRPDPDGKNVLAKILKETDRFEIPGLLLRFFRNTAALFSAWLHSGPGSPEKSAWADLWRRELNRGLTEADSFNIAPPMVLERLLESVKTGMTA